MCPNYMAKTRVIGRESRMSHYSPGPMLFQGPASVLQYLFQNFKQTYPFFINEEAPNKANTTDAAQSLICCVFSFLSGHCLML